MSEDGAMHPLREDVTLSTWQTCVGRLSLTRLRRIRHLRAPLPGHGHGMDGTIHSQTVCAGTSGSLPAAPVPSSQRRCGSSQPALRPTICPAAPWQFSGSTSPGGPATWESRCSGAPPGSQPRATTWHGTWARGRAPRQSVTDSVSGCQLCTGRVLSTVGHTT